MLHIWIPGITAKWDEIKDEKKIVSCPHSHGPSNSAAPGPVAFMGTERELLGKQWYFLMNQNQLLSVVLGRLKEEELIYTHRDPIYLNFHCCNPSYKAVNFHPRNLLKTRKAGLFPCWIYSRS